MCHSLYEGGPGPSSPTDSLTEGPHHWTPTVRVMGESGGSTDRQGQHIVAYQYNFQEKLWPVSSCSAPCPNCFTSTQIQPPLLLAPDTTSTLTGPTKMNREEARSCGGDKDKEKGTNYIRTISSLKERKREEEEQ